MADFTSIYHRTSYPAISSANALNAQTNRTILITGASAGIGRSIAKSFSDASASRIILLGRTQSTLIAAAAELPNAEARVCDISSTSQIQELWEWIRTEDIHIDVLVLNAALTVTGSLKTGADTIWGSFETTVLGNLRMAQEFVTQMGDRKDHALINISSFMAHSNPAPLQGAYSASKAAFANLLQHLAEEVPSDKATIINVHPGAIFTDAARTAGFTRDTLPFDDGQSPQTRFSSIRKFLVAAANLQYALGSLPGDYCVWASTPAASFLHGRFVWANWDVEELSRRKAEIEAEEGLLKIGVQGVEYVDIRKVFGRIAEKTN